MFVLVTNGHLLQTHETLQVMSTLINKTDWRTLKANVIMAHGHLAKLSFFLPPKMWSNLACPQRAAPNPFYSPKHAKTLSLKMLFSTSLIYAKDKWKYSNIMDTCGVTLKLMS